MDNGDFKYVGDFYEGLPVMAACEIFERAVFEISIGRKLELRKETARARTPSTGKVFPRHTAEKTPKSPNKPLLGKSQPTRRRRWRDENGLGSRILNANKQNTLNVANSARSLTSPHAPS